MTQHHLEVSAWTGADAASTWAVLADIGDWSRWGPWEDSVIEREGAGEGLGAVWRLQSNSGRPFRFEVTHSDGGREFEFELWSGLPVHSCRGEVHLRPLTTGGTQVRTVVDVEVEDKAAEALTRDVVGQGVADAVHRFVRYVEACPILDELAARYATPA